MYNKQVWHDRKHQVEVFRNDAGEVIGTIISFRKGICLINPHPDVLIALYQEAKIRRIGSVNTIILTDRRPEFVRGLCTFLGYSRTLKRGKPLSVRIVSDDRSTRAFIDSCCMQIMRGGSRFSFDLDTIDPGESYILGDAVITAEHYTSDNNARFLCVRTSNRRIDYYDERHTAQSYGLLDGEEPDVAVRAVQLPLLPETVAVRNETLVAHAS